MAHKATEDTTAVDYQTIVVVVVVVDRVAIEGIPSEEAACQQV